MIRGRAPHAILLVGAEGVGKTTLALDLAAGLLCTAVDPATRPCGVCRSCRMVLAGGHPDVHRLAPEGLGRQVGIGGPGARARGIRDLIVALSLLPVEGGARVAIIESAQRMNDDAQAALLKTLEEPAAGVTLVLCADAEEPLLPTIRSRCARLRLGPVSARDIEAILADHGVAEPPLAARLARASAGRPGLALAWAVDPDAMRTRGEVGRLLLDLVDLGPADRLAGVRNAATRAARLSAIAIVDASGSAGAAAPAARKRTGPGARGPAGAGPGTAPDAGADTLAPTGPDVAPLDDGLAPADEGLTPVRTPATERRRAAGRAALAHTVVIKLNGGMGTSMGMDGPKSLLPVKDGLTFLDIIVRQILYLRQSTGVALPLVLMNSFVTHAATMAALEQYDDLTQPLPLAFVQSENPKIDKATLQPATWPDDPSKEWCPPGHGDIYASLVTSGMLAKLLDLGYEYAFVSNADNLGAVLDPAILGYFAQHNLPFLMEVADRTPADRKGGHLAQRPDGQLILRELSQCPPDEIDLFQDIERYRYFNTNNLWLHLPSLQKLLDEHDNLLDLPLIRNEKPVDPTQPASPRVYQLETAMGSALALFKGAQAMRVPRTRFIPVKKCNDLLLLWSDAYELSDEYLPRLADALSTPPLVILDDAHYALIGDLRLRFPHGAPSLVKCGTLRVTGDVYFGRNVTVCGDVAIAHDGPDPLHIADDSRLPAE